MDRLTSIDRNRRGMAPKSNDPKTLMETVGLNPEPFADEEIVGRSLEHSLEIRARDDRRSHTLEADLVIKALGFDPEDVPTLFGAPELAVTRWGTIKIDQRTMMTALDGVFAAGDIVRGASLVVWGVRDGRDAAEQMHLYLKAKAETAQAEAAE